MPQGSALPTYSALYAFGDSLSDAGNLSLATAAVGVTPVSPPYFQESYGLVTGNVFSNGPTWVQDLSKALGLGTLAPSLATGTDFAYGGAETGSTPQNAGNPEIQAISLPAQITQFQTATPHPSANALYTVSIGGNDLFDILSNTALTAQQQATDVSDAVTNEINFVKQLVGDGAKSLLVLDVPDLGKTPRIMGAGGAQSAALEAEASQLSASYNASLGSQLASIVSADKVTIGVVDAYQLIDHAVADPAAYGLSNVTSPVWSGNFTDSGSGTLASTDTATQDKYLFWDQLHPTETGHMAVAALAEQLLGGSASGPVILPAGAQFYAPAAGTTVFAGAGNDTIIAAAGQATAVGSSGSLTFVGGTGASSVIGGAGTSTIFGGVGGGSFAGGSMGGNILISEGASGANTTLTGGGAGDRIFGSAAGNDLLVAGPGRDSILGGNGHTTIQGGSVGSVIFTQAGSSDVIGGTGGGDSIVGGAGSLNVSAQNGDAVFGGSGALSVAGSKAGADSILGGAGPLIVNGQGANMLVAAASSSSGITTGNGASLIFAGAGSTSVTGGAGSMQVVLGSGHGSFTEGSGSAMFDAVKGAGGSSDVIDGFRPGTDRIQLFGYQPGDVKVTSSGGSSMVSLSDGTTIQVAGVSDLGSSLIV